MKPETMNYHNIGIVYVNYFILKIEKLKPADLLAP